MIDEPPLKKARHGEASCTVRLAQHFHGIRQLLEDDFMSDITVVVPGGAKLRAHRIILAASSDLLKSEFRSKTARPDWSPKFGLPETWQWVIDWMYGCADALPLRRLVDTTLVAERMQMTGLLAEITALRVERFFTEDADMAEDVALQILRAWDLSDLVSRFARHCVPACPRSDIFWKSLWAAEPQNVTHVLEAVPVACEADRLRLAGQYFRNASREITSSVFNCILSAVHWDCFPSSMLEAAYQGNFLALESLLGRKIKDSSELRKMMHAAIAKRCQRLDTRACPEQRCGYVLPGGDDGIDLPNTPSPGLFASLRAYNQAWVQVRLSSVACCNGVSCHVLFDPGTMYFGTEEQSLEEQPWIEVSCSSCEVCPTAFGLKHGSDSGSICEHYVVEAETAEGHWVELLNSSGKALTLAGEIIPVSTKNIADAGTFFCKFRVRMTGPNSSNKWQLMVAWFEVYGKFRSLL